MPKQIDRLSAFIAGMAVGAILVAASVFIGEAHAGEFVSIQRTGQGFTIQRYSVDATPHIIKRRPDLSDEAAERAARWEEYCQPRTVADKWGAERYVYAKPGCEFGKDHD